ncbi:hypothetical protein AYI68_g1367 [Smittium mucronatum]|uniref:Uncharacterized protein n=1 Tax=Smittium mucronatum TaxID=133383 RepID=A0A1R0H5V8_9FUNG|nr:hypothetical protein AYI68_g1367 [Smittium mucronatum]
MASNLTRKFFSWVGLMKKVYHATFSWEQEEDRLLQVYYFCHSSTGEDQDQERLAPPKDRFFSHLWYT